MYINFNNLKQMIHQLSEVDFLLAEIHKFKSKYSYPGLLWNSLNYFEIQAITASAKSRLFLIAFNPYGGPWNLPKKLKNNILKKYKVCLIKYF